MKTLIESFQSRHLALLWDDAPGLARGVLVAPAATVSTEIANRLFTLTGGLPFVALSPERTAAFMLSPMTRPQTLANGERQGEPKQCLSVEAREGVSTGISASDRATTIRILGEDHPSPRRLVKPGHIFPVETRSGGVLVKSALPEAALDLVTIAGFTDAALYLDLLGPDGAFFGKAAAQELARSEDLPFIELADLVRFRLETEVLIERVAEAKLPTRLAGELRTIMYRSKIHGEEHLALLKGDLSSDTPILTRVQPERAFTDIFGGSTPSTRQQIHGALGEIGRHDNGVFVYLRSNQSLPPATRDAAMMREYGIGAQILRDLGVKKIELLTGSNKKLVGLKSFGIEIVAQRPIPNSEMTQ